MVPVSTLELRPSCECCDVDLPPTSPHARICTFECTYCARCAEGHLAGVCPTCGGEVVRRPIRTADALERHPASTARVVSPEPCPDAATGTVAAAPARGIPPITRHRERAASGRASLDALLDDEMAGSLALAVDGRPWVVPMLFARDGDRVLLHGSTGAGALRHAAAGTPVVLTVFALDGLVVAHTTFESSANYRSAVVQGVAEVLEGEEKTAALDALSNRLLPGRTGEVAPMTAKEQAATVVLALPIRDGHWLVKTRTGPPGEPEGTTDAWCGVIPLHTVAGEVVAAPWTTATTPVPASVRAVIEARRMP